MANAPLKKIIKFYCRFTPSYSAIGFHARRLFWRRFRPDFAGQTWLVTGGSEGIGGSAARQAFEAGATIVCVARSAGKLEVFAKSLLGPGKVSMEVADFSLQADIQSLLARLAAQGVQFDVVVNNVGIQKKDQILTKEGIETSFATNILGHYLLTRELLERGMLKKNACVIEVSSGGMYNHAMKVEDLNITGPGYLGVRAYGLSKRAQVMLAAHLQEKNAASGMSFYAMHPGWVDTASVGRSMPRFRAILQSVLRDHAKGADTIVWLAGQRPKQAAREAIWFDRKERASHIFAHTRLSNATGADVVATLESFLTPAKAEPEHEHERRLAIRSIARRSRTPQVAFQPPSRAHSKGFICSHRRVPSSRRRPGDMRALIAARLTPAKEPPDRRTAHPTPRVSSVR